MEESGHYYTVYFTSLAVGFKNEVAYRHAVLAQMPDEVGWLDAANMHINQCVGLYETDLDGVRRDADHRWRYDIEYGIHSLPDKAGGRTQSAFQRETTKRLLAAEDPRSLKFGLLLHRLGDTYAHSVMANEKEMYTVTTSGNFSACLNPYNLGHARHGHSPDYPFLRTALFEKYLEGLYTVLNEQARQPKYAALVRSARPLLLDEVKNIFRKLLTHHFGAVRLSMYAGMRPEDTQYFFIQKIRESTVTHLGITLNPYKPESKSGQSLSQFLSEHKELHDLNIDAGKMTEAVGSIRRDLEAAGH